MSTKCTILCSTTEQGKNEGIDYHFYFDYADNGYHLKYENQESFDEFLRRVGELLSGCPLSDAGVYMIDLNKGKIEKFKTDIKCESLEELKKKGEENGK